MTYKTWQQVGSTNTIYLNKDRFPWTMPRGRRQTLKQLHDKNELFRKTFVYIEPEDVLLWHSSSGDLYEVVFKKITL